MKSKTKSALATPNTTSPNPVEKRLPTSSKGSQLPSDYLKMVEEVFANHFELALKSYQEIRPSSRFVASGAVFADEIVATVALVTDGQLSATTAHASADFDPKASSPTVQDLLSACVDALGTVWSTAFDAEKPETIQALAEAPLTELENIPFEWTSIDSNQRKIFVKMDKTNPILDQAADQWLKTHDPDYVTTLETEESETEKLFVTGPSTLNVQRKKR